ncbi:hypothetical protein F4001_03050 [Candidatus Poribacteria bacterium]|nr:hypothetical protein [Candidatus Poribacteria bacterium]
MRKMGLWREYLIEKLADRESAINYLQAILEDYQIFEDVSVVQRSLHTDNQAQGRDTKFANQTNIKQKILDKIINDKDTPLIDVLTCVLRALGYQLSIQPIDLENLNRETYADVVETQNTLT